MSPLGRYIFIVQGASTGLIVPHIYWALKGRHNPKANVSILALLVPLLKELIFHLVRVYPGFHIGLRPHSTLGYAGVSPLQGLFGLLKRCRAYGTHNAPELWCACPVLWIALEEEYRIFITFVSVLLTITQSSYLNRLLGHKTIL